MSLERTQISESGDEEITNQEQFTNIINDAALDFTKQMVMMIDTIGEISFQDEAQTVWVQIRTLFTDHLNHLQKQKNILVNEITTLLRNLDVLKKELRIEFDIGAYESTPLIYIKEDLQKKLNEYQMTYNSRKAEINELMTEEKKICLTLGKDTSHFPMSPLPKEEDLNKFRLHLEKLHDLKYNREKEFLKRKSAISDLIKELNYQPSLDFEKMVISGNVSHFKVTDENMMRLEDFHDNLSECLASTIEKVGELRSQLNDIWELLGESPKVRSDFLTAHPGNSIDTLRALKNEIVRCNEKKKSNIKILIDRIRDQLTKWWDKCYYTVDQRNEFLHFTSDCYTEDLLTLHELELEKIKIYYEKTKDIYELIEKRKALWNKMLELEHRADAQDRYKNRGGQLLKEEKERRAVANKLPKIEQQLLELVNGYEMDSSASFTLSGQTVRDMISREWELHKENKQVLLSAKKQARENVGRTPRKSPLPTSAPKSSPTKVKIALFKTPKLNTPKPAPKIQVNGSSIKRASFERCKRVERKKKLKQHTDKDRNISSSIDYHNFEDALTSKPACRSTLSADKIAGSCTPCSKSVKTPRTPRSISRKIPESTTPRTQNRSKSPNAPAHLTTASGNLPIII